MALIARGKIGLTTPVLVTSVNLATDVTSVLAVANGGTGQSVYTDGQILFGVTAGNTLAKGDHGNIGGLGDDDHTQYALLAGRSTPQVLNLGTQASANTGIISSTSHSTKGSFTVGGITFDEVNKRIGINVSSPSAKIDIADQDNAAVLITEYNDADGVNFRSKRARGTIASPTALLSSDRIVGITAFGHNGSSIVGARGTIEIIATENWNSTNNGTAIRFNTTALGSTTNTTKITIDGSGNLGVGTATFGTNAVGVIGVLNATAPTAGAANTAQMYSVSGQMHFMDSTGKVIKMSQGAAITAVPSSPSGGTLVDTQARTAIDGLRTCVQDLINRFKVTGGNGLTAD